LCFRKALRKDGVLVIAVPNANSRSFEKYREAFYYLTMPVHVHLFSPPSLNALALQSGFSVEDISSYSVWKSQALSLLMSREFAKGKKNSQFSFFSGVRVAFARLWSLRSLANSLRKLQGDILVMKCRSAQKY